MAFQVALLAAGFLVERRPLPCVVHGAWAVRCRRLLSLARRQMVAATGDLLRDAHMALDAIPRLGATHVLVPEGAYLGSSGDDVSSGLLTMEAEDVFRDGTAVLPALAD